MSQPVTELDPRYSAGSEPVPWETSIQALTSAELFWISTVRSDGHPHVTPLIALWDQDALHFCTGVTEQKFRNVQHNSQVVMTTGANTWFEGLDLVVEGEAVRVSDEARLQELADGFVAKYGEVWRFDVRDGAFEQGHGPAWVFSISPRTVYAYSKGTDGTHTRYRF